MSLSDLELLQLVETVKVKQKGPQGEPGVGIVSIEQFDETSFTITLTNGYSKKVVLPAAADGQPGEVGPPGPRGETGSAGRAGRDGVQGPAGRDGKDGLPGSFVETAVVNGDGHLLVGLSDGQIIDVGRVVGPAGDAGERGDAGLPGVPGADGAAVLSGPRAPQASDGQEGDHWIDISSAEFSFFKKNGEGWTKLANLRQPARDPRVGPVSGGGGSGSGSAKGYTTSNLPLTGLGRSTRGADDGKAGGINKPGGNIIPKAVDLKFQSNMNRWTVDSLDALDEALPIGKVDILPDEGKYEGDMVLHEGALWIYSGDDWIEVGGAVDVSDFALKSSVQRVEDNLDLVQETVGAGKYKRVTKPLTPVGPDEGEACFLQDGGAEATTFAEVENIQLNKVGVGPYADFSSAKKGDYLLLQSAVDGDFGLYVIRNATEFDTFWDFGLEISSGKVVGSVPEIDEGIIVRTSRPTFTVAQATLPDFSATGQLWFDTTEHQLKVWDDEAEEFVVTGGGAETHVGEDPPVDAAVGDLWYCTKPDDLTLYVLAEKVDDGDDIWAAAAPPVSLDGIRDDMQSIDNTLSEVRANLFAVDNDVKLVAQETTKELDKKVSLYGNNTVEPDGGEWRIQGANKTFIKVDTNNGTCGVFNLQTPPLTTTQSAGYVKENAVLKSGTNKVSNDWKIQGPEKTHFHVENNQTKIYWLQDPSHAQHPVTMGWADNKYAQSSSLSSYLPLSGGTITGKLSFATNARIDCNNSNTVLSERGCFELRANADKPLIFSSGSGSKKLLSFYGYDDKAPDKRSEKAYISAGGEARFNGVYSNGKELATKEYVDANAGGSSEGAIAKSGTNTNPTLAKGELYLCTTDNTLRVGI